MNPEESFSAQFRELAQQYGLPQEAAEPLLQDLLQLFEKNFGESKTKNTPPSSMTQEG